MLSTPLICCSIGVATDCSMVCASAPVYTAEICTSGGAMAGNSGTGNPAMDTTPTITVRREITIATMGRRIKNLDTVLLPRRFRRIRLRTHDHAGTNLLHSLGNHAFTWLQSLVHDPQRSNPVTGLHIPNADLVSGVDHGHLEGALHLRNRTLRNEQRAILGSERRAHAAILSRAEQVFLV